MARSAAGAIIDCLEFARSSRSLSCAVALNELPRLADILAGDAGALTVALNGYRDDEGKLWLDLKISGELVVCCQRCLGGVTFPVNIESHLQLIASGEAWPDDELADDSSDAIAAGSELGLLPLMEDEILLALPIAPRHEHCESPGATALKQGASPFAALAALKKH